MKVSAWKTLNLDFDRSSDGFTDEDVDRFTELLDLGEAYEFITVLIPTIESATITPYIQNDEKVATNPFPIHVLDDDATGSFLHATSAGTGGIAVTFRIGGVQYIRLYTGADQTADRAFLVKGFNREPMD